MDHNNKTDKYFRDRLGFFEESPPESGWENISGKLGERRKKRVFVLVFRIAAGMAILLSTGLGYYWITREKTELKVPGLSSGSNVSVAPQKNTEPEAFSRSNRISVEARANNEDTRVNGIPEENSSKQAGKGNPAEAENQTGLQKTFIPVSAETTVLAEKNETDVTATPLVFATLSPIKGHTVVTYQGIGRKYEELVRPLTPEEAASLLLAEYNADTEPVKTGKHEWILGSEVAPLYSDRNISSDKLQSSGIDELNKNESGVLAYAGGFRVAYSAGKRFSVQSGIYYSRYGQQKNQVQPVAINSGNNSYNFLQVTNSTGTIRGVVDNKSNNVSNEYTVVPELDNRGSVTSAEIYPLVQGTDENITVEQLFDYFELPLIMKYKMIDRKLDFSFTGGLVTNFLIGNTVHMINDGVTTTIGETTDINKVNYLGSLGLGIEYPVTGNLAFTVEPRFRYYLNSMGTSQDIRVHPFSFGFFAGLNFRF